jgi:hypothetical protein
MKGAPRFRKERLAKVLEAFAAAGQPVRKVKLPDGTEILAGDDLSAAEADEGKQLEELMDAAMPGKRGPVARGR